VPLTPPPRDSNGKVVPHNHPGIGPDDGVIRRVSPHHLVPDPKVAGGRRLSTKAFTASTEVNGGMSVDLQALIEEAGLDAKAFVISPRWVGAVRFTAGALRGEGLQIGYDPRPDNPYHGEAWGTFTKALKHRLLGLAKWFVPLPIESSNA